MKGKIIVIVIISMLLLPALGISANAITAAAQEHIRLQSTLGDRKLLFEVNYIQVLDPVDVGTAADMDLYITVEGCQDETGSEIWVIHYPDNSGSGHPRDNAWHVGNKTKVTIHMKLWDRDELWELGNDLLDINGCSKDKKDVTFSIDLNEDHYSLGDSGGVLVDPGKGYIEFNGENDGTQNSDDDDAKMGIFVQDNDYTFTPALTVEPPDITWKEVSSGGTLNAAITIKNTGDEYSFFKWEISCDDAGYMGAWTCNQPRGRLYAGHQSVTVSITLKLPDGKLAGWARTGSLKVSTDVCGYKDIPIEVIYKKSKVKTSPVLSEFIENMLLKFPQLERILKI